MAVGEGQGAGGGFDRPSCRDHSRDATGADLRVRAGGGC